MTTMKKPAKKMQMGGMADSYTNYKMGGKVKRAQFGKLITSGLKTIGKTVAKNLDKKIVKSVGKDVEEIATKGNFNAIPKSVQKPTTKVEAKIDARAKKINKNNDSYDKSVLDSYQKNGGKTVKKAQAGKTLQFFAKSKDTSSTKKYPSGDMIPSSPNYKGPKGKTSMGPIKKPMMKKGGSFPDLNKDGKITKADILKGRGVIAKKGMKVKKAQNGLDSMQMQKQQMAKSKTKDMAKPTPISSGIISKTKKNKMGGKTKKCAYGCK